MRDPQYLSGSGLGHAALADPALSEVLSGVWRDPPEPIVLGAFDKKILYATCHAIIILLAIGGGGDALFMSHTINIFSASVRSVGSV